MPEYDNTNSGALFKNDKKGNDTWPDYQGSINVESVEFWISAWLKKDKNGKAYMSLSVRPKKAEKAAGTACSPEPGVPDFDDDDIAF